MAVTGTLLACTWHDWVFPPEGVAGAAVSLSTRAWRNNVDQRSSKCMPFWPVHVPVGALGAPGERQTSAVRGADTAGGGNTPPYMTTMSILKDLT